MEPSERDVILKEVCSDCGKPIVSTYSLTQWIVRANICLCKRQDASQPPQTPNKTNQRPSPQERDSNKRLEPAARKPTSPSMVAPNLGPLDVSKEFEKYRVIECLGEGNIHTVYRAEMMVGTEKKELAIKIVRPDLVPNSRSAKRFLQEATKAMELDHPFIAGVYDCGVTSTGLPFQVTDFVSGTSLSTMLKNEGFLDIRQVLEIAIQLTEALDYAHQNEVVHRGIRTSNIFAIKDARGSHYVKILDFGVSRVLPNTGRETKFFTAEGGEDFGDPIYMSPEQCLGKKLDHRTDIYSLGCVLYECLCGKPPVVGLNPMQTAVLKVGADPKPLNVRFNDLDIPDELDAVVMLCLAVSPDNRYQTIKEIHEDLQLIIANRQPKLNNRKRAHTPPQKASIDIPQPKLPAHSKSELKSAKSSAGALTNLREVIAQNPVVSTMVLAFLISGLVTAVILLVISGVP